MHLPCRMFGREIQRREIVEIVLDVRAFGDGEAHVGEDGNHLVHDLHGRMHRAGTARPRGQGQVDVLGLQPGVQLGAFQLGLAGAQGCRNPVAQAVDHRPLFAPLIRAQRPHPLEQAGDGAGFAEGRDTQFLDRCGGLRAADGVDQVEFELGEIGHCAVV